jgi:hypothetical protein
MTPPTLDRPARAWRAMEPERRLAAISSLALLVTMFFPWYGLQSLNRKTGVIHSHSISAFGDVSFVEAAIFLVAAAVVAMLFARAEGRQFHLPGGDGTIVMLAGAWTGLLIFYRVFDRPTGYVYPVGIEWGFFLAFVAAGGLAYAGWRMRAAERPEPPLRNRRGVRRDPTAPPEEGAQSTIVVRGPERERPSPARDPGVTDERGAGPVSDPVREPGPGAAPGALPERGPRRAPVRARERGRYPPAPPEQLSFEDPPAHPG